MKYFLQSLKTSTIMLLAFLVYTQDSNAQIGIPSSSPVTEPFNIGTGTTASLPANWKMSAAGITADWATGTNVTAVTQGASSGSPATGGRYNWGNGTTTSDRAIGFMTSGSYASPNTILAFYQNTSGVQINDLAISFDFERYRINTTTVAVTFFTSTDGSTWTSRTSGDIATTDFATGANSYTFTGGTVVNKNFTITGINIPNNGNLYLRWVVTNGANTNSQGIGLDNVTLTAALAPVVSNASDIVTNPGFTYPINIAYTSFQGTTLTTGNSVEVGQFNIRDGGATTDADALSTTLTAVSFNVTNSSALRRIAIFDGSTNVGEVASAATASFSSLSLSAADGGSKTFSIRVSFINGTVTDNQQFSFTVNSATAGGSGSGFAAGNAGGAATSTSGDNNKIEVTATDLIFGINPTTVSVNSVMTPNPTVVAVDANVNTDLDFTSTVSLSTTGTFAGGATTSVAAVNGIATFNNLSFSAEGTGITIAGSAPGVNPTGNSNTFDVTNPQPEINVQQGGNDILTGGSFGFGNQVSGTSSSAITFTIQNTGSSALSLNGTPKINLSGANTDQFSVDETATSASVGALGSTTFTITFSPTSAGAKSASISIANDDANENPYTFSINGTGTVSAASDIISTAGYVYTSNVAYDQFQSASSLNTGNSVGAQGITIRDGGAGTDADNLPTILNNISFATGGSAAIRTAALFDAGVNIAEVAVNGGTSISFTGLNISAADGGTKDLELRVTYQSAVTDNQQVIFTVGSATPATTGSAFAASDAGGAASSNTGDNNRIEVTATSLAFVQQPSNAVINVAMSPAVTVSANDGNGNRDLDFTEQVRITSTGTLSGSPVDAAAAAGLATFSSLTHTATGTGLTLNAERTGTLDWDVASNTFSVSIVSAATDFFRSNVTVSGNWSDASSWETSPTGSDPWITSSLVPDSVANAITIRSGDTINITVAGLAGDQIVVQNGGALAFRAAGTFTLRNGAGDDLTVQNGGTLIYNKATTPVVFSTATTTVRINTGGILSVQASGVTAAGTGVNSNNHIYDDASILEWKLPAFTPSASGVTYFPNANASTVPVLRFTTGANGALGGGSATVVNGKFEVATGVTISFTGAGTKTFRNGIIGAGNVSQGSAGQFIISGTTAELGGAGTITLGAAGLVVNAGATATLSSGKAITGGTTTINGIINLNGFNLSAASIAGTGTISGSDESGLIVSATSTLRFTTGAQTLKNLNITGGTSTLATALNMTGGLSAGNAGNVVIQSPGILVSNGNLTLRSNQFGTARIGTGSAAGGYLIGNVTVERYLPNNGFRSWRLLSVPTTTTQTIRQAWQEGNANPNPKDNNVAGYGTQITGVFSTQAAAAAAGFDTTSIQAGMQTWNGSGWSNVTSTNQPINNFNSYFLFVRGDRTQGVAGATSNTSATTLRTTGTVYTGDQLIGVLANSFSLIPNLFASSIDFSLLTRTGGVNNVFYIWDSKKLNGSSLGAYQTFSATNGFQCTLGGGSYTLGQPNTRIESGQSFFVTSGASGTITLPETAKMMDGANLGFRPVTPANRLVKIDSRIYAGNELADANVVVFDNAYPVAVGAEDAMKFTNAGLNFAIQQQGKQLAVEGRPVIAESDVINFNTWNLKQQQYRFEFVPNNMGGQGLEAVLEDKYLHTSTPVSLSENTSVSFTVDANPASAATDRFRIVLTKTRLVPLPAKAGFVVSPNPVEGKILNLQFRDQAAGNYSIKLVSNNGQVAVVKAINHAGGNSNQAIRLPQTIQAGTYNVEVTAPGKEKTVQQVIIR